MSGGIAAAWARPGRALAGVFVLSAMFAGGGAVRAEPKPSPIPAAAFPSMNVQANTVLAALANHDFALAGTKATEIGDPVLIKLAKWADYRNPGTHASFGEISRFLHDNPDWPDSRSLRINAENSIALSLPPSQALAWLDRYPPLTARGRMAQIAALDALGKHKEAAEAARAAWRKGNFSQSEEKEFYKQYRKYLTREDHAARLDRLIWDGRIFDAHRLLGLVDSDTRALAEARIALRRLDPGVDGTLRRVPERLRNDPGLLYERLRWRRIKGRDVDAREILDHPPRNLVRPELWWAERTIEAHRALANGEASVAYKLAANHGLTRGASYAEAEFLSGWIALRFLDKPATALKHFEALYAHVSYPVSVARGAYWAGRAAQAENDREAAHAWYAKAARYGTVFYGQLARLRIADMAPLTDPTVSVEDAKKFAADELVRAARFAARSTDRTLMRPFLLRLVELAKTPAEHRLITALALHEGRPELAVAASKASARHGVLLIDGAYPDRRLPAEADATERDLTLAVMRQESAFDTQAVSSAGARGLMQLVGSTAKSVSRALKLPFNRERLLRDPDYNARLGVRYLGDLVDRFGGSYVLAIAAYNAGPARVRAWSSTFGDPRRGALDVLDWIEMIPLPETRNYVQRVLENLEVYRARHGVALASRLLDDLSRGALPALTESETP